MPDNRKQRHEATPAQQDARLTGRDMGEAIYARHARFVWPTSIASSLARRFAPFTEERLSLATDVLRRWSVANSSLARLPDFHWLQAFAPGSGRIAVSGKGRDAERTVAASCGPPTTSSSVSEITRSMAPEASFSPAIEGAPAANTPQETGTSLVSGAAKDASAKAQRSTEVSGRIRGVPVPVTPDRAQTEFASPVAESVLRAAPEVSRSPASEIAPRANAPQESGTSPATALQRSNKVSERIQSVPLPAAPNVKTDAALNVASLTPSKSDPLPGSPVAVYSGPPIIRRSYASRQAEVARADSAGRDISESSNVIRQTTKRSNREAPVQTFLSAGSASGLCRADRVISESTSSKGQTQPSYSVVEQPVAREAEKSTGKDAGGSRSQNAVASQAGLTSDGQSVTSQPTLGQIVSREHATGHEALNMTHVTGKTHLASAQPALPQPSDGQSVTSQPTLGQIVSREHATGHEALNMTHATGKTHLASAQPALPQPSDGSRSLATQLPSPGEQVLLNSPATLQTSSQPVPPAAHDPNSVWLAAEDSKDCMGGRIVANSDSGVDRSAWGPLMGNVVPEDRVASSSPSFLHLQRDTVSSEISPADSPVKTRTNVADESSPKLVGADRTQANSSVAPTAAGRMTRPGRIEGLRHSLEEGASGGDVEISRLFRSSEPTFRSTCAIFRSAGTAIASGASSSPGISRGTMAVVVVQESVVGNRSHAEPFVLSRVVLPGDAFHKLSPSSLADDTWPAASSGSTAIQSIGFRHRNWPAIARPPLPYDSGHPSNLSVARQASADATLGNTQLPLPAAATSVPSARSFGGTSPDIGQLANRVYEVLVRRLASERQRRGR